ncbi:MAG: hypothetical protein II008_03870 [Oscillospiraceae bacterium]|nr:hypothetical protein [Oscillospiraceae bacterium]
MEENEMITSIEEELEPLLPDGWTEKDDIFTPETWGAAQTDEPAAQTPEQGPEETEEPDAKEAPTTEQTEANADQSVTEEAPTEAEGQPQPEEQTPRKLKFKARVDREDSDVELDESEVPALWQKAQVADRWKNQRDEATAKIDRVEQLAKAMGYQTADEMLTAAGSNYRKHQIEELVSQGTPQAIAEDYVDRKMGYPKLEAEQKQTDPSDKPAEPQRDLAAEARELSNLHPELVGKDLPQEVMAAWMSGVRLKDAYSKYEVDQQRAQDKAVIEQQRKEIEILKHNAAAAAKAPVKGVTGGGKTDTEPDDPFARGLDSYDW